MTALSAPSLQALAALVGALPDAVVVLDAHGVVVLANARAAELLGATPEDLAGSPAAQYLPERFRRAGGISQRIWALSGGEAGKVGPPVDVYAVARDGGEVPLEIILSPLDLAEGRYALATLRELATPEHAEAVERLAAVVRSSSDAILTKDLNGIITSWNQGAQRIYGYTAEEAVGRPVSFLMDAASAHEMADILERIGAGETVEQLETQRVDKDGRTLEVSLSVSPLRDQKGKIVGAATVARDIGERRRGEQKIRALLEAAPDAVVVTDELRRIVLVNRRTEELFGYPRDELIGSDAGHLVVVPGGPRDLDRTPRESLEALERRGRRADGREFPLEMTVRPLQTSEGLLLFASIRDITARKEIEEELRRSNRDLEQFAYVASHDLSEPLRVIAGFVDLLADRYQGRLDEEADKFIGYIVSGVERLQQLIDDLLAYSRAGRVHMELADVDTAALVAEVVRSLEPQIEARGAHVEVSELPRLRAERALLRQVFQNLISNALKFSDQARPSVSVKAVRQERAWAFLVQDDGPGVEPRHAERIFEMFQRLHSREVEGSGIGLAIVKRLVERHGGRVWVSSAEPKGSVFTFTIPDREAP